MQRGRECGCGCARWGRGKDVISLTSTDAHPMGSALLALAPSPRMARSTSSASSWRRPGWRYRAGRCAGSDAVITQYGDADGDENEETHRLGPLSTRFWRVCVAPPLTAYLYHHSRRICTTASIDTPPSHCSSTAHWRPIRIHTLFSYPASSPSAHRMFVFALHT